MNLFAQYDNFFPLLTPADITSTATATPYVDLRGVQKAGFYISVGNVNSGTATDTEVVTVQAAAAEGGTEAAIAFRYRTCLVGTNQWGAITTADTTGVAYALSDDDLHMWIEIDPDELAANDYRYVRCVFTDTPDMANFVVGVSALLSPRYKQTTAVSATASASA